MKEFKYRVLYKPPMEKVKDDNPDTWRRVWYFTEYDCPEKLDLEVKILQMCTSFNINKKYIEVQEYNQKTGEYQFSYSLDR